MGFGWHGPTNSKKKKHVSDHVMVPLIISHSVGVGVELSFSLHYINFQTIFGDKHIRN